MAEIYLAGGCFWGTEHYFKNIDGVIATETGYANGSEDFMESLRRNQAPAPASGGGAEATASAAGGSSAVTAAGGGMAAFATPAAAAGNDKTGATASFNPARGGVPVKGPTYEQVYTDTTGFAETVRVTYDPEVLPLGELLEDYFCAIDPLSVNRQGEDRGTRYRTGIYYVDEADIPVIKRAMASQEDFYGRPLAVESGPLTSFFPAEERHQDYLDKNPEGYCHLNMKMFRYPRVVKELRALLEGETDWTARMANTAALIKERFGFFWVGFYLVRPTGPAGDAGSELILGPFQGPIACMRIKFGRGVCGTAWKERKTLVVPDVEAFPGHIACSSLSRSEIVVPIFKEDCAGFQEGLAICPGGNTDPGGTTTSHVGNSDGEVIGVLDIDSTELATFDQADALWLNRLVSVLTGRR